MKRLALFLGSVIVGIVVALTYYLFEAAVRLSIDYIWDTTFQTDTNRLLVVPVVLVLTIIYFATARFIDPMHTDEGRQPNIEHVPQPTIANLLKVLIIGFLSLVAGASLGPEAILVPACAIIGTVIGTKVFPRDKSYAIYIKSGSLVALFAAFFNSFIIGMLSLFLVVKIFKRKLSPVLLLAAALSSASATIMLAFIKGHPMISLEALKWDIFPLEILGLALLVALGYGAVMFLARSHDTIKHTLTPWHEKSPWWISAIIAALGLSAIYLLGGPLVQFTGNESIQPLIEQSKELGVIGLFFIVIAKIIAIAWSKAAGFRGGLIFPSFFVVAGLVLLVNAVSYVDTTLGIIACFTGMILADRKVNILL